MSTQNGQTNGGAPPATGTRKRSSARPSSPAPSIGTTSANLPPARKSKAMKSVSPPLSGVRLNRFIYSLLLLTMLMGSWYGYRLVQHKKEVGGWWNLATGKGPVPGASTQESTWGKGKSKGKGSRKQVPKEETVEEHINALARALGMPSGELARAIAGAVRQYVPPASLSSIAAKETGPAVDVLLNEEVVVDDGTGMPVTAGGANVAAGAPGAKATGSAGIVGAVVNGMEGFVGMDEP